MKSFINSRFFCFVCGILLALFASLALLSLVPQKAYAQRISDLATLNLEGISKEAMPNDAVRDISNQVVEDTARSEVIEALGEPVYLKNKIAIDEKILKQSSRFIPFVNPGEPSRVKEGWKVPVELKVSNATLRKMLLENGFVASSSGQANILPLVTITDRTRAVSLRWWTGDEKGAEQKPLLPLLAILHAKLAEEIQKQNLVFTKLPAAGQNISLPETLKVERPSAVDLAAIGNYFKSSMLAKGDVRLIPSTIAGSVLVSTKIQVLQSSAPDRVIAEVVREFTTDPHASSIDAGLRAKANVEFAALAKDLSAQVQAAWQRGSVGTNFLSLAVRGNLNPVQQIAFKTAFIRAVHEARDLKERLFERGQVTYEVDYSGDANQFASRLKALKLAGFDLRLPDGQAGSRLLTIDVRAL